jgi:hypothetical protein
VDRKKKVYLNNMTMRVLIQLAALTLVGATSESIAKNQHKEEAERYIRSVRISSEGDVISYLQSDRVNGDSLVIEKLLVSAQGIYESNLSLFKIPGVTHTIFFDGRSIDVGLIEPNSMAHRILRFEVFADRVNSNYRLDDYQETGAYAIPQNDYTFSSSTLLHSLSRERFQFDSSSGELKADTGRGLGSLCESVENAGALTLVKEAYGFAWRIVPSVKNAPNFFWPLGDTEAYVKSYLVGLDRKKCEAYFLSNSNSGTFELSKTNLSTAASRVVFKADGRDLVNPLINASGEVDLVHITTPKPRALGVTAEVKGKLNHIDRLFEDGYWIEARSTNDRFWLIRHGDNLCQPVWSIFDTITNSVVRTQKHPAISVYGLCVRESVELVINEEVKIGS